MCLIVRLLVLPGGFVVFNSVGGVYMLLILMVIGFLAMDVVYVAVALNYCTQCQLLIFLIRGLNERIEEKSVSLHQIIRVPKLETNEIS